MQYLNDSGKMDGELSCHNLMDLPKLINQGILQKTAFSMVKSKIALGSASWLFGCLFVTMPKMTKYTENWLLTAP